VTEAPLIPAPLYGLRTWRLAADERGESLRATSHATQWPSDGEWLEASCTSSGDHSAPAAGCSCGIHAWHPRRNSARRVLASRFDLPGIVEAAGAVEVQEDGFRAERGRPYALVVTPGRNKNQAVRLAERYRAQVVEVAGADALLAWCRDRGLGIDERTVDELLGPERVEEQREARRRRRRTDGLRIAVVAAIAAVALLVGYLFESGPTSHGIFGRAGWVQCPNGDAPKNGTC
jgi:hypothetical protein